MSSGADGLEAAAVVTDSSEASPEDVLAVADLAGAGVPVLLAGPDGTVGTVAHTG